MSTPRIATIPRTSPGRPRAVRKQVEELIGTAGYLALMEADLFVVSGAMVRDLALILNEPVPLPIPTAADNKKRRDELAALNAPQPEPEPEVAP